MSETKAQKGITLVALIITIVILLILATVAITSVTDTGIIEYANNAVAAYNKVAEEEQEFFEEYKEYLKNY